MRGLLSLLLSALIALGSSTALAQQAGDDVPPPPPPPDAPSESQAPANEQQSRQTPPAAQEDPAAWNLLSRAVEQLARGNKRSARRLLEQLAEEYPDHRATTLSADARAVLVRERPADAVAGGEEQTSGLARAELAFFQTIHGIVLGTELCAVIECEDPQAGVLMLGAGGGLGLALSLIPTADGITPGHSSVLNSGTVWGFANGVLGSYAFDIDGTDAAGLYAASQLAGLGLGALVWDIAEPTAGEVAMANSGGFWLGFLTFMGHVANELESSEEAVAGSVLLAADLGIIGGALLSQRYPMSRGRSFVIDTGGVLGFLVGIGTYILVEPDVESVTAMSVMGMLGTVTGLGAATGLTRDWDESDGEQLSAGWGVAPTDGGAMLTIGGSF